MHTIVSLLIALTLSGAALMPVCAVAGAATASDGAARVSRSYPGERLGEVSFSVSCAHAVRAPFSRGVALLHDFWYAEAREQFAAILAADPSCAMAHWGLAMSNFHQIWDRPDDAGLASGWKELQAARSHPAQTPRERDYLAALGEFFRPGERDYQARIDAYVDAMAMLHGRYPGDVDAAAFYALSLLAAEAPDDTSLTQEHRAMAVLSPLFVTHPDHPGVVHYIIHACDTPSLAPQGLAAANHYGEIAASGPHAVHMPGHIFARLGMWQADIAANTASVAASAAAEARHMSGAMDQFHSDDFLLYAYLQSGQDAAARQVMNDANTALARFEHMADMADGYMVGMFPYYRTKLPIFYALEMRDWSAAAALQPVAEAPPETQTSTYWARAIADGHLHQPQRAQTDLAGYDSLIDQLRKGRHGYFADSTGAKITRSEILGWVAFAAGNATDAAVHLREAADLQDKVGQGEVDIPAREMLGDVLLEAGQPTEALREYQEALRLSPARFNGLFNAGRAAEAAGDMTLAVRYYTALLQSTDNGSQSTRPELAHARSFVADATPTQATLQTAGARATRQRLIGAWQLVAIEVSGSGGPVPDPFYQPGSVGLIVYDVSGSMSVQIAGPRRTAWHSPPAREVGNRGQDALLKAAAFDTYYAYFGTWSLDEATSVVTHRVVASLIPAETGTHYAQTASIDERGRLTLTSTDTIGGAAVVRKKVWERGKMSAPSANGNTKHEHVTARSAAESWSHQQEAGH